MVKNEGRALYFLLGFALCFLLLRSCIKPETIYSHSSSDTTWIHDSTIYIATGTNIINNYIDSSKALNLSHADSMEIAQRMYYSFYQVDSFYLKDSAGAAVASGIIEDSIFANRITFRRLSSRIERPSATVINLYEPEALSRILSIGMAANASQERSILFLDGLYQDRKGNGFLIGYGMPGKNIKFGYFKSLARF
jgi:hypothetical protein